MTMMGQAMPEGKRELHERLDTLCGAVNPRRGHGPACGMQIIRDGAIGSTLQIGSPHRHGDDHHEASGIAKAIRTISPQETEAAIDEALQRLVALKIAANFDSKFLCLATTDKPVPYLGFDDFAGGLARFQARRTPARPIDPWDIPIQDMF